MNQAQNTFENGLLMDFHPLTVPNTAVTNCLNGTFLTYNGNEFVLQNDMGNGKVETAALPAGYIPLGTTSFGGIIYIVSYNPLKDVCQIGCFPSPERNFSYEELTEDGFQIHSITNSDFKNGDNIINFKTKVELTKITLNPGDKFLITSDLANNADRITDYKSSSRRIGDNPKFLRLHVATKDSSGRLVYLDSSLKWYKFEQNKYYYIPKDSTIEDTLVASKYSIFNSKLSGNLYLIAELETISMFSSTYTIDDNYNLILNLEWKSDNWNESQKGIDPKYINFEANGFQLINNGVTSNEFSLEVYDSECDTVEGNIEGRYPDINIDLQNKVNTKSIFCGKIPDSLIKDNAEDEAKNFKLIPAMEFGALPTFELSQNINFAQIGSGKTFLDEWRYFKQENSLILTYGFQDYPKPFCKTFEVSLHFMSLDSFQKETDKDIFQIKNMGKVSYAGSFTTELEFDSLFEENNLYIVKITKKSGLATADIKSTEEEVIGYRFLYTSDFFNDSYISDVEDFNKLYLPDGILTSDLTITTNSQIDTQVDKIYSDSELHDETNFESNKCIVKVDKPTPIYKFGVSKKTSTWMNIKAKANIKSNYPLFNEFDCYYNPEGPEITKKSGEGVFDPVLRSLKLENELKLSWDYTEQTIQYQHGLIPLMYESQDAGYYGLNFDPIYKHFAFGDFAFITNMGYLREGCIDYCNYSSPEDDMSENISYSQYWYLDLFQTNENQYYRHNGNQCYPGSQFQAHFNEYAKTKDNFIPTSFVNSNYDPSHNDNDADHRNRNAMTFIDSLTGADFYWYGSSQGAHITTARKDEDDYISRYTSDGKGRLLYSSNVGLYEPYGKDGQDFANFCYKIEPDSGGRKISKSDLIDNKGNIKFEKDDYNYCDIPVVTVMMKAVDKNGNSLHLFTNNLSIISPYEQYIQALPTVAKISFGDIFGMFLMQTYKYVTEDLEEDFICPDDFEIEDESNKSSDCILGVKSEVRIKNFKIRSTYRNQLLNIVSSIDDLKTSNNLKFSIESKISEYLEINDSVTFSTQADNTIKDNLSVKLFDKNVLVKNCKGQSYTLPKTKALNESHIYGIKNNSEYVDLSVARLSNYDDFYKILNNISYNEESGLITYNGTISENGNDNLQPSCVDVLKLDEDKTLVIDLDKYKRIANRSWEINNNGHYSTDTIQGISSKFSFSKLLNVLR